MNNNALLAAVATEIESLSSDLAKVNATIDMIGKPAIAKAREIAKAIEDAKERFASALANEQVEARNLRLGQFSDISVEAMRTEGDSIVTRGYIIRYKRNTWDMAANESIPTQHKCNGFAALDDDAFEYLITEKPQAIPAEIMKLAPGNPEGAFDRYFQAKRRGYTGDGFTGSRLVHEAEMPFFG